MKMLWPKYATRDIDAVIAQFKSTFAWAEALGRISSAMEVARGRK